MATFKVKTFNELSGKGQNGDIAIIERADINGNKGFSFRDASGWSLPFVQIQTLGANLMTTNTSQSVSAPKTFQDDVTVNSDFSVIGATDIDLGFAGNLTIDAGNEVGSKVIIDKVEDIELSADAEINLNAALIQIERTDGTTKGKITFDDFVSDVPSIEMFQAVGFETGYVSARKNEVTEEVFCNLFVRNTNTGQSTTVDVRSDFVEINGLSTSPAGSMTLKVGAFSVQLNDIPTYADNATALADLYPVDGLYKTATGELRIVV
jgi:hypothetical protein